MAGQVPPGFLPGPPAKLRSHTRPLPEGEENGAGGSDKRASNVAKRASSRMSQVLLLATESLPNPTLSPCERNFANGARPWPSLAFDFGQCATLAPLSLIKFMSTSSTLMQ